MPSVGAPLAEGGVLCRRRSCGRRRRRRSGGVRSIAVGEIRSRRLASSRPIRPTPQAFHRRARSSPCLTCRPNAIWRRVFSVMASTGVGPDSRIWSWPGSCLCKPWNDANARLSVVSLPGIPGSVPTAEPGFLRGGQERMARAMGRWRLPLGCACLTWDSPCAGWNDRSHPAFPEPSCTTGTVWEGDGTGPIGVNRVRRRPVEENTMNYLAFNTNDPR